MTWADAAARAVSARGRAGRVGCWGVGGVSGRGAAVLLAVVIAAGCTPASTVGDATGEDPAAAAPYAESLWDRRPVLDLATDMAPDLKSLTGRETVTFSPDQPVCELVFRAWPNAPNSAAAGSSLLVIGARVDGAPVGVAPDADGAPPGAPATLVSVALPRCINPGQSVRAELDYRLRLGVDANDRVAVSPGTGTAWFGSGFPLLAWVRGRGWARDPAVPAYGESAVSEVMNLRSLQVSTPAGMAVLAPGSSDGVTAGTRPGAVVHHFHAPAVRDVAVAVGRYRVLERDLGGVRLRLAAPQDRTRTPPEAWADAVGRAVAAETRLLGGFPYRDLAVAVTPGQSEGTEFPAAIQVGDVTPDDVPALVAHELAHQWFYGLVGNNQSRDPWLDESFATAVEALAAHEEDQYTGDAVDPDARGHLGDPMPAWAANDDHAYIAGVYVQGAAALLEGRRADPAGFDAALRAYIRREAQQIATPADALAAFHDQPATLEALRRAGALPTN